MRRFLAVSSAIVVLAGLLVASLSYHHGHSGRLAAAVHAPLADRPGSQRASRSEARLPVLPFEVHRAKLARMRAIQAAAARVRARAEAARHQRLVERELERRRQEAAAAAASAQRAQAARATSTPVHATEPGFSAWLNDSFTIHVYMCESGGNPKAYNPSSGTSGKWQFMPGTWRSVTGLSGNASDYSESTQDWAAYRLYRQSGWSPWSCASM